MDEMIYLEELVSRYPALEPVKGSVREVYEILRDCFASGHKLLVAGKGGSGADSEHIVGELMKGFVKKRPVSGEMARKLEEVDPEAGKALAGKLQGGLPSIALTGHPGLSTAFLNDVDGLMVYAQQIYGYGQEGDVFLGISTSGNAANIHYGAVAAKALGMKVVGYSRRITRDQEMDFGVLTPDMKKVISGADYLSLHLPGTGSTTKLLDAEKLSWLKPSAFLINTGRGEVIDEAALIRMLQEGRLRGAALDVFEGNLPKEDNPLLSMENVIVTPHTAAFTTEALERMSYQAALGIVEVLEQRPVTYAVNKLSDSFEENQNITAVMDFFRHEFNYQ
mgnify:CR=1 FL=1